ncbi:unnamed protein product [Leptidea sinapis]|uniref:Transferrin-like domain-containing protein n=1 Tax=Leptidea sinapis TaxID=189913 RepID=A0A5E4R3H4_9NEOP|nr:unnamed protein product [Leptidea sinapis]
MKAVLFKCLLVALVVNVDNALLVTHGSSECLGNIVQDCALDLMRKESDKKKVEYCVEKSKLPPKTVEDCVLTGKGVDLQLHSEYHTSLVSPSFVPTVTIGGTMLKWTSSALSVPC